MHVLKIENLYREISYITHNIFYVPLSKNSDADRYVIIRKLLDFISSQRKSLSRVPC